jgi:AcrR family transcriptional regulator
METLMKDMHPTKRQLIEAVSTYLDANEADDPCSDTVLRDSGVSKGSMYHHFEDFSELIETTRIYRFSKYVDYAIDGLVEILGSRGTKEDVRSRFLMAVKERLSIDRKRERSENVHLLSMSIQHQRLGKILGKEQERLTERWASLYAECVKRGYAKSDLNPRAVSVLWQACILGRIVDDITIDHMEIEDWIHLIHFLLDSTFFGAEAAKPVSAS